MSRYLSIRFDLVWAFSTDGASVQILYHVHMSLTSSVYFVQYEGSLLIQSRRTVSNRIVPNRNECRFHLCQQLCSVNIHRKFTLAILGSGHIEE